MWSNRVWREQQYWQHRSDGRRNQHHMVDGNEQARELLVRGNSANRAKFVLVR
jgi:hypothetical protein